MKQIIQNVRWGRLKVEDVPDPTVRPGHVLISNVASVVSAGTEKMVVDLARKSLLGKALQRPDHVKRILTKLRQEGLSSTIRQVSGKLDEPIALGYSSCGIVLACGDDVMSFKPGDCVASNGSHAGVVCVPKNLCALVPASVRPEEAAFAVLGAIALNGVRLAEVKLGEFAFVIGLGLIGQFAVALLKAQGCRVFATDPDVGRCDLAVRMGAESASPGLGAKVIAGLTSGLGADAVVITASTDSNGPISLAAESVRKKGRVVAVGAVGLDLPRRPFYFKEAEFVVSCSYGPGRYDALYEERGLDYPAPFVRWTEQRNIETVLSLMAAGSLDVSPLITHRFAVEQAQSAYQMIEENSEPYLGIVIQYPEDQRAPLQKLELISLPARPDKGTIAIGCLGAGNFARLVMLPLIRDVRELIPKIICSARGVSALSAGKKLGFAAITADEDEVFRDPDVKAIFILTQHNQHASQVVRALQSDKHVFVEKPLALTIEDLRRVETTLRKAGESAPLLMVGFNRRFSRSARKVKDFFAGVPSPLTISIRFNAGEIPPDHWIQDADVGGGRITGEACHGIDLATYLAGSPPVRVHAASVSGPTAPQITEDQCFITLWHENGSVSSVAYLAGGDKAYPKERVEVLGGGRLAVIEDFRDVVTATGGRVKRRRGWGQDKGHRAELEEFTKAVTGGGHAPIPWEDLRSTTLASILARRSIAEGMPLDLSSYE